MAIAPCCGAVPGVRANRSALGDYGSFVRTHQGKVKSTGRRNTQVLMVVSKSLAKRFAGVSQPRV
ncbi:hypothetical protein, partial [Arthrobacter sp. CAN_A214]|uniref:hypothetical protein n=1 Tax=Arthrobacter sp. CAN_A214 TaxID=2787720 RepID=UPI002FEF53BE